MSHLSKELCKVGASGATCIEAEKAERQGCARNGGGSKLEGSTRGNGGVGISCRPF